jgi:hypothetical protein
VSDAIPEIVFTAIIGRDSWLRQNTPTVVGFLRAMTEVHAFVNDPSNESVARPIFQRITTPDIESLAGRGLVYIRDMGMWPDGLEVSPKALETTIDLMIRANLLDSAQRGAVPGAFDRRYLDESRA